MSTLKSAWPVLGNPATRSRAVLPTRREPFRHAFANAVDEAEAHELYESYAVPGAGKPLFEAAAANLNRWTEVTVDTVNPLRGSMLVVSGGADHTVPPAVAKAAFHWQKRNPGTTEPLELPNRGHSLTIDHGWKDVATATLAFVQRFAPAQLPGGGASRTPRSTGRRQIRGSP